MRWSGGFVGLKAMAIALPMLAPMSAAISTPAAAAAGPFVNFTGEWTGGGDIFLSDGSSEKIRCKASYSVGPSGEAVNINVNCASDSTRVNIISNVVTQGTTFAGTWRETTRQVDGEVKGRVPTPGQYQASLKGTGFSIELAATSNGKQQAITIISQGTDVQSVRIALRRA